MSVKPIVAVTLAENNPLLMRELAACPEKSTPDAFSKVTWPLIFECTPKVLLRQPAFIALDILQNMISIQGNIYAEMSTTAAFSDCCIGDPDNAWLELTLTDNDLVLARFESCFGVLASHASLSVMYLDKQIQFTDFKRDGYTLNCTSKKFPLPLARQLVLDNASPKNFRVTMGVEWTELIMNII